MNKSNKLYQWKGINHKGENLCGVIEAPSLAFAKSELGNQGIINKKISRKRRQLFARKITAANITYFCRQIATLIKAGIPIIQTFDIVAKSQANPPMINLVESIKKDLEIGLTFSEALHKHPTFFNKFVCNLIDAGEKSGKLDLMLEKVANYKEKIQTNKRKVKKALTYPLAVLLFAHLVTFALLILVVPQFESLFQSFGAELPGLTQVIIKLSAFFKSYWFILFALLGGLVYGFIIARKYLEWFSQLVDKVQLKFPLIGSIIGNLIIARFSRTLAITFAAGLPLVDALSAVAGLMTNSVYAKATDSIRKEISTGQQLQFAMRNTQIFPNMVIQMVAIGEESGALETMLSKIADFFEEEVNHSMDTLSTLLEPIIMAILGLVVGTLVIAMYLPIFKLGSAGV